MLGIMRDAKDFAKKRGDFSAAVDTLMPLPMIVEYQRPLNTAQAAMTTASFTVRPSHSHSNKRLCRGMQGSAGQQASGSAVAAGVAVADTAATQAVPLNVFHQRQAKNDDFRSTVDCAQVLGGWVRWCPALEDPRKACCLYCTAGAVCVQLY
jgi:hypothetical protein